MVSRPCCHDFPPSSANPAKHFCAVGSVSLLAPKGMQLDLNTKSFDFVHQREFQNPIAACVTLHVDIKLGLEVLAFALGPFDYLLV